MLEASRLQPGDIVRVRDERWRIARHVTHGACAVIEARGCDRTNRLEEARFILPAESIERIAACERPQIVRPQQWRRVARAVLGAATAGPTSLLTAARASFDILPFQLEPALTVTSGTACRLLIADEVGLGKTIQAALVVAEVLERVPGGRALVVTPAGLREQWRSELWRWLQIEATIVDSAALAQLADAMANPWITPRVVITSVDFVKRAEVLRSLEALVWDVVVFDEAHGLAGRSDRAAAGALVGARARHVVLLTATPHAGDDAAFARLCGIGDIGRQFPLRIFRRTRADAGLPASRRTVWLRVRLSDAERRMHRALAEYARTVWRTSMSAAARLAMGVLARRAASSAGSLAISLERRLALLRAADGGPAQLALPLFEPASDDEHPDALLAVPGLADAAREREWLARLLALARMAAGSESKVRVLRRLLARATAPVLVFTEYRDTLARVSAQLDGPVVHLHGGLTSIERQDAAARFTHGDARVMLATDAASEGLNLQHRCRLVVNLELPWSPVRLEQRVGRIDRIGQRSRVHALHLVAAGSIEDHLVARLLRRAARARASLDEAVAEPALRMRAREEAARLATARAFLRGRPEGSSDRPVVADASRRRTRSRRCWAFRLRFTDRRGDVYWETVFGIMDTRPARLRTSPGLRAALAPHPAVADTARHCASAIARVVHEAMAPQIALSTVREDAIRRAIGERGARMAAALLQRSLFDRRSDRAAEAQRLVIDDALRRCSTRLEQIDGLRSLAAGPADLAFAVVLD